MKKVLIVAASYKPAWIYGGPTYCISALCETLSAQGYDVHVITTNANGKADFTKKNGSVTIIDGIPVIYYKRITGDHTSVSPAHTRALMNIVREFDIVHIQGWWNWVSIMALQVCRWYGVPHVLTPHGSLSDYTFRTSSGLSLKLWLHKLLFKKQLHQTLLHVTSSEERNRLSKALPKAQTIELPNMLSIPALLKRGESNDIKLKIVFLGRINKVKNLELLIRSLLKVNFPFDLNIIGEGEPVYIATLKAIASNHQGIRFTGPLSGDQKFQALADADILALMSHTENFGNVVIEALSQGTAVMITQHVGTAHFVQAFRLGYVIPAEIDACVAILETINSDRSALENIRKRSPVIIASEFNPESLSQQYVELLYSRVNPGFTTNKTAVETA
ncbi:MAG TPA: glycosyltransferase [Saprospiraceae bacterium]|nr:glycosyltransferase [Saprospiraceae bacterium]